MPGIRRTSTKPTTLPDWVQELRRRGAEDIDEMVQTVIYVVDEAAQTVQMKYRPEQAILAQCAKIQMKERGFVRIKALKPRQVGLSTWTCKRNLVKILCKDNWQAITVAHQQRRSEDLLNKLKFAYTKLPGPLQFELSADNDEELEFADFNSRMIVGTANNIEMVRGGTCQDVHISELPRMRDAEHIVYELHQICHDVPGTTIIDETTGKKYGSFAHEAWKEAKKLWRKSKIGYQPVFFAWQDNPIYDLKFDSDKHRDMCLAEAYEYAPALLERQKIFNLTPGNVWWAYKTLRKANGNWEKFLEDYPCSDEEAWRSKGDLWIGSSEKLLQLQKIVEEDRKGEQLYALSIGHLENGFGSIGELTFIPEIDVDDDETPYISFWRPAISGRRYCVSGDSAGGMAGGDPSSSFVIDMHTGEMVAEFHGLVQPHQHAKIMESLAQIYNFAIVAPESNSIGLATLQELMRRYPNIYRWQYLDDDRRKPTNKLGWWTNEKSRALMLALLKRMLDEVIAGNSMTKGILRSRGLIHELRTFVFAESGTEDWPEAAPKCHDDRIVALAIAWFVSSKETQGMNDDILTVLRPQEARVIQTPDKPLDVEFAISKIKEVLRMEEYNNNDNQIYQSGY